MKFFLYTPNFRPIASFNIAHFSIKMKTISVSINAPMTGWDGILVEIQYCSMSPGGTRHQSQDIPAGHDKHSSYMRKNYHTRAKLRDISPNQNGWIFGKIPNGLWPHPSFLENHIAVFFPEFMTEEPFIMAKICDINFWIGNDPLPPPFGIFPKIHPFW